jgi:hypothetical protein
MTTENSAKRQFFQILVETNNGDNEDDFKDLYVAGMGEEDATKAALQSQLSKDSVSVHSMWLRAAGEKPARMTCANETVSIVSIKEISAQEFLRMSTSDAQRKQFFKVNLKSPFGHTYNEEHQCFFGGSIKEFIVAAMGKDDAIETARGTQLYWGSGEENTAFPLVSVDEIPAGIFSLIQEHKETLLSAKYKTYIEQCEEEVNGDTFQDMFNRAEKEGNKVFQKFYADAARRQDVALFVAAKDVKAPIESENKTGNDNPLYICVFSEEFKKELETNLVMHKGDEFSI